MKSRFFTRESANGDHPDKSPTGELTQVMGKDDGFITKPEDDFAITKLTPIYKSRSKRSAVIDGKEMIRCCRCKEYKEPEEFFMVKQVQWNQMRKQRYNSYCKICNRTYVKAATK